MANTSIFAAFERMWQHTIAKIDNKLDLDMTKTEEIPNLYVWKKYTANPVEYTESEVTNTVISHVVSATNNYYGITYGDEICVVDGAFSFVGDSASFSKKYTEDAEVDATELKGKYVKTLTLGERWYFIPSDSIFTHVPNTSSSDLINLIVDKATLLTVNPNVGESLGYISSESFSTYPTKGEHTDGYWYEYVKQLGDSAVIEGDASNYTETDPTVPAWAKASTKPTYTASEVGALPDTTVIPSSLADLADDSTHRIVTDEEKSTWNAKVGNSGWGVNKYLGTDENGNVVEKDAPNTNNGMSATVSDEILVFSNSSTVSVSGETLMI